jgi:hypothetical protein
MDDLQFYSAELSPEQIAQLHANPGSVAFGDVGAALQPGDADQDLDFDQLDLVKVQIAAKYLTGVAATWGEGDWNGGPGGSQGSPPVGDGQFNQLDVIAALTAAVYLTGPYAALSADPARGAQGGVVEVVDGRSSTMGDLFHDAQAKVELASFTGALGDRSAATSPSVVGDLGNIATVYVPEPATSCLLVAGLVMALWPILRAARSSHF